MAPSRTPRTGPEPRELERGSQAALLAAGPGNSVDAPRPGRQSWPQGCHSAMEGGAVGAVGTGLQGLRLERTSTERRSGPAGWRSPRAGGRGGGRGPRCVVSSVVLIEVVAQTCVPGICLRSRHVTVAGGRGHRLPGSDAVPWSHRVLARDGGGTVVHYFVILVTL